MAIKYELGVIVKHCFVCRDSENLKMKTLMTIALILTFSVVVLCDMPLPPFCELTDDQLEKFFACEKENAPAWFLKEYDDCKDKHMPGTTDVEALKKICDGEETAMKIAICLKPAIDLIEDELKEIEIKCLREAEA
ncbi:uncharacterized protein LOC106460582 [Limulus polyphemus]|uniref:Uncharacterized protein LOC106460582 n=1 Tax=Limulus polyphemus TaxID=6850 RepID=A0ABM1B6F3_LIMPO|nr:uncharacterized protein LOC106460582 [Limulus polyphemus]